MTIPSVKPAEPAKSAIPYLIIGAFVLFAAYIGVMVQRAMRTNVELVSADYYQQELGYQQRIDATSRTAALPAPVRFLADEAAHQLTIQLPAALAGQGSTGEVHFMRPSDSRLDFTVPFHPNATGGQLLSTASLRPGHWRVRLAFTANGQDYFVEEVIAR